MSLFDFYVSDISLGIRHGEGLFWSDDYPVVEINGQLIRFTEFVEHGEKPISKWEDLRFIGTTTQDKIRVESWTKNNK